MTTKAADHTTPSDVMRGVAGGVLLGVPLLYTQEIWEHGSTVHPFVILLVLATVFGLSIALSHYVGFSKGRTTRPVGEAFVGAGLSLILATLLLLLMDRIGFGTPLSSFVGIVALTAAPIAIGFAVGSALAPEHGGEGSERMVGSKGDLFAAAAGAVFLALNIAPTEEPVVLAGELGWMRLTMIVGASLLLPYLIVFYAEFGGRDRRRASDGATQGPVVETLLAYVVAFVLSALLLVVFRRTNAVNAVALSETVVLAFPASLGAALGRMLV